MARGIAKTSCLGMRGTVENISLARVVCDFPKGKVASDTSEIGNVPNNINVLQDMMRCPETQKIKSSCKKHRSGICLHTCDGCTLAKLLCLRFELRRSAPLSNERLAFTKVSVSLGGQ